MRGDKPQLRALEVLPFREGGKNLVCLRDPMGIAEEAVCLDPDTFFIVSLLDGKHTVLDIQEAYVQQMGELLFSDRVRSIIRELDDKHLLETPEFEIYRDGIMEEFAASPVRMTAGSGGSYPQEPIALAEMLGGILKEAPAAKSGERPGKLRALVAPHIDYERGRKGYAHAYREVEATTGPQLVLLLGVSHAPARNPFILTRKHFATPFGQATTDVEFVEKLAGKLPFDGFADEFNHRSEHSIELEAVWLKFLKREPDALRIIPVLCGSMEGLVKAGKSPANDEDVKAFIEAVRETSRELRETSLILAGADLSHVGPQFGDAEPVRTGKLAEVETTDMQFLMKVGRGDGAGAYAAVASQSDSTRICGLSAIYTMLELAGPTKGRLLAYEQWKDPKGAGAVTFASVGLYGAK